jgi:hypothetical protein
VTKLNQRLSERELCPDDLLAGQEMTFAGDTVGLRARGDWALAVDPKHVLFRPDSLRHLVEFDLVEFAGVGVMWMTTRRHG